MVVKTDANKVMGGYTSQSWGGACGWRNDPAAFLFSGTNHHKHELAAGQAGNAIWACNGNGPVFGAGNDLFINNGFASSSLGVTYTCRVGTPGSGECVGDFAGVGSLTLTEVEVFYAP